MQKPNKIDFALEILRADGWNLQKIDGVWYDFYRNGVGYETTEREIIKWASQCRLNPLAGAKKFKHYNKRKNRLHTKKILLSGDHEDIPQNQPVAEENTWNWC